jgi:mRNA-degrading endonuclease toxin of MazEF toxin-antitoxin module
VSAGAPKVGEVIPYRFLWSSEHEAGEESGRKLRPCVVVASLTGKTGETRVAVLPITHSPPAATRSAVELPRPVKALLGLSAARSWIMCDEFNEFTWPALDAGKTPAGKPSFGFLTRGVISSVRHEAAAARARGTFKVVPRD